MASPVRKHACGVCCSFLGIFQVLFCWGGTFSLCRMCVEGLLFCVAFIVVTLPMCRGCVSWVMWDLHKGSK